MLKIAFQSLWISKLSGGGSGHAPRPPSASPLQRSHLLSCLCQKPGYGPFFVRKQLGDDDAQVTSDDRDMGVLAQAPQIPKNLPK